MLAQCVLGIAMPSTMRGGVGQRCRAHEDFVGQLLGAGAQAYHAARSPARGRQRQCGGQRSRAVSPRTPPARSPSVDHETDIVPSERANVILQARAISLHWDSGVGGRAFCPTVALLGPTNFAATIAERAQGSALDAVATAMSEVSEEGVASSAAPNSGQLSTSVIHSMTMAAREPPMRSSVGR